MARKARESGTIRSQHGVVPGVETEIRIVTLPKATCHLSHAEGDGRKIQLDADDHGVVRFHARPGPGAGPLELQLEGIDEDGRKIEHVVQLQPDTHAWSSHPVEARRLHGKELAALAGDDLTLPAKQLVQRGFPPRPDPVKAPARYARWLRRVSNPVVAVTPRKVPHPGVRFAKPKVRTDLPPRLESPTLPLPPPIVRSAFNSNFNTWSGAYLTRPIAQFFLIQADWNVPGVFPVGEFLQPYSAVAEWIGLDDSGTDLYQSGTDSELWSIFGWTITNYWMWIESLPFAPWGVPNFPVSPGDEISADIFIADANGQTWFVNQDEGNGGLTRADNNVWFMLYNLTKGASFWGTLSTGPYSAGGLTGTGYTGTTAEFIIERPSDLNSGNPYPLAPFGFTTMWSCWYGDSEYGDNRLWRLGPSGSTPFDATLTYINMVDNSTENLLALPLSFPDPTDPSGTEIFWLWLNSV